MPKNVLDEESCLPSMVDEESCLPSIQEAQNTLDGFPTKTRFRKAARMLKMLQEKLFDGLEGKEADQPNMDHEEYEVAEFAKFIKTHIQGLIEFVELRQKKQLRKKITITTAHLREKLEQVLEEVEQGTRVSITHNDAETAVIEPNDEEEEESNNLEGIKRTLKTLDQAFDTATGKELSQIHGIVEILMLNLTLLVRSSVSSTISD